MRACTCVCTHTHIHTYIHTHIHIHIHTHAHIRTHRGMRYMQLLAVPMALEHFEHYRGTASFLMDTVQQEGEGNLPAACRARRKLCSVTLRRGDGHGYSVPGVPGWEVNIEHSSGDSSGLLPWQVCAALLSRGSVLRQPRRLRP